MHEMTAGNLKSAFGGESMAHMRYIIWGGNAEKEGFPNVARLFRAISRAEQVHATNHFEVLKNEVGDALVPSMAGFGLTTTSENLAGAIAGEEFEINEMYPAYLAVANDQQEKDARVSFHYAISAEKIHAAMYKDAKAVVDQGKDIELGIVQICSVCGHTLEGEPEDKCPVCGATRDKYIAFE